MELKKRLQHEIDTLTKMKKDGGLNDSGEYTALHWLNSVIGFAFGIFIIVNSYHLKINAYEWFMQWLNAI